jgi:Flp pilus assembly protein TadG
MTVNQQNAWWGRRLPWKRSRSGQAVLFLLLVFTVLVFFLLFNVDLHRVIQRKTQAQNAGDAAALAATRWQAATLNLVGELNLMHVLALAAVPMPDRAAVDAITNMQARLCFTGPLAGLYASQVAAKNNHIYVDPALTDLLRSHVNTIRTQYANTINDDGEKYYKEPWLGAWDEYADMLEIVCADGIAAGPDNAQFFAIPGNGHILLSKEYYEAVLGRSWCWFYLYQRGLLESYHSFHDWPPLPDINPNTYDNCEIYGVGVQPVTEKMKNLFTADALETTVLRSGLAPDGVPDLNNTNLMDFAETWYMYKRDTWASWDAIKPDGEYPFPAAGEIRPEYDYAGADVVIRLSAVVDRITPGTGTKQATVNWTAAAKAFGYLEADSEKKKPDSAAAFVLPAFRNVRLIPADTASGSNNSSSDVEWMIHVTKHLKPYMEIGTTAPNTCSYCRALVMWEPQSFRQTGIDWLTLNSHLCKIPTGGGGGHRGGGSRRGH